jgi:hypothetical protein
MNPDDFHAEDGELVVPALKSFSRFIFSQTNVTIQGPARVISTTRGRQVIFEPETVVFPGSFQVSKVGPKTISVSEGRVNGLVAYMGNEFQGSPGGRRRIDGLDDNGDPHPEGKPVLECREPETGDRTYLVLYVQHNESGDLDESLMVQNKENPLGEILHEDDGLPKGQNGDGIVWRLVAVLYWKNGNIEKIRQVVWYDQEVWPTGGKARLRAAA